MFSRIREAVRILTYREPQGGPDHVTVERVAISVPRFGKFIAGFFEVTLGAYAIGYLAGHISTRIDKLIPPTRSLSVTTLAGAVSFLLVYLLHSFRADIEAKLRAHLNLTELLAPYFGHRLENAARILKG